MLLPTARCFRCAVNDRLGSSHHVCRDRLRDIRDDVGHPRDLVPFGRRSSGNDSHLVTACKQRTCDFPPQKSGPARNHDGTTPRARNRRWHDWVCGTERLADLLTNGHGLDQICAAYGRGAIVPNRFVERTKDFGEARVASLALEETLTH